MYQPEAANGADSAEPVLPVTASPMAQLTTGIGERGGHAPAEVAQHVAAVGQSGSPVPLEIRRPAEKVLGADLSRIRIHSGTLPARLARRMRASAFTVGSDVFVSGAADAEVLAHELVHTVQQQGGSNSPSPAGALVQRNGELTEDQRRHRNELKRQRDELRDWFKAQRETGEHIKRKVNANGVPNPQFNEEYRNIWKDKRRRQEEVGKQLVEHKEQHPRLRGGTILKNLEGGMASKPVAAEYSDAGKKVFKADFNLKDIPLAIRPNSPSFAGISEEKSNFARRAVATSKLDKLLGTGVVPGTKFATLENRQGAAMDFVKGEVFSNLLPATRVRKLGQHVTKKGIANLNVLDYLSGEVDRHDGNYMIDSDGRIWAHDNDFAFGKDVGHKTRDNDPKFSMDAERANYAFRRKGVPEEIDAAVRARLNTPGFEEDVRAKLAGYLTPEELKVRMRAVKHGKEKLNEARRVEDWRAMGTEVIPDTPELLAQEVGDEVFDEDF